MTTLTLLVLVVVFALIFEFVNGFHDAANAIATVVSTGVLSPRAAVLMAATLNVLGAFLGTAVASTIGKDLLDPTSVSQQLVLSGLIAAISWNVLTWYFGIPSSSSHALVGGLVGGGLASLGPDSIQATGIQKVLIALVASPLCGFFGALVLMIGSLWVVRRWRASVVNRVFRRAQLLSASFVALSHGHNDAQKAMGVITMALVAYRASSPEIDPTYVFAFPAVGGGDFSVPGWTVVTCALTMGLGTAAGGWRIVHTMGSRIFKLRPIHGFCAESGAALVIGGASILGLPVSTTHCITSSIMGAGATTRLSAVSWGVTRRILWAWFLTIPACAALGALAYEALLGAGF